MEETMGKRKQSIAGRLAAFLLAGALAVTGLPLGTMTVHAESSDDDTRVNYALDGVATAQKAPIEYWGPDKLIDGIINRDASKPDQSRWSSEAGAPCWVKVDLTEIRKFDEIKIAWENGKTRRFHIEMSNDDQTYTTIYESEDLQGGHPMDTVVEFNREQFGRYIRITVDALIDGAYPSVSIYEVEVIGTKLEETGQKEFRANYALGKSAAASASPISYWGPDKLTDGIINRDAGKPDQSRWSSEGGAPQWVSIDLGEPQAFDEILIAWEAGGKIEDFHIEGSNDGVEYTMLYDAEAEKDGYPEDTYVYLDEPESWRYVKITADKMTSGAYPSVSIYEVQIIGTKVMNNLAADAVAESNGDASEEMQAGYINDGTLNTRWTSSAGEGQKTVTFTFDEVQSIQSFILEWNRKTAKDYKIEAEVDGQWQTLAHYTKVPKTYQEILNLDEPIQTSKVRIVIDAFLTIGTDRDGATEDIPAVSLHEVEMYGETYDFPPRDQPTTVQDIADAVLMPGLADDAQELPMPEVQEGYTVEFVGADYEQVITRDRQIIKPLVDTTVIVNFEVTETETGEQAFTPDIEVTVAGQYDSAQSINAKPQVLPELQQWFGREGEFQISDASRILVDPDAEAFMEAANIFSEDYKDVTGKEILVSVGDEPAAGDFYFVKSNTELEKETYILDVGDAVTIEADEYTGAYWATRSILQIIKQSGGTIAKGIAKDYPKYELRGMMLDVARLPVDMYFLEDLVKMMSWYKMNDFQVHLNDNVFTSTNGVPDYSGFRLESKVEGLTNTDVYYTKDEFRDFITNSKELGVNIVPEFDTPGHSGAFTKVRPELGRGYGTDNYKGDYLDLDNKYDEVLEFMKGIFAEYTTGDNPVYPEGTVVHVGTDEYKGGGKENFRKYQDAMLKYVRDELGYTPRVWGSQTENNGETPITVEGVQMNLWYVGYANPKEMYELGYDVINTNDGDQYIVPGAGYYYDYLSKSHIYGSWQPNVISGFKIPAGDEQMLGANFCVWNDKTGPINDNGTSDIELFDRIYDIMPIYGCKLWGDIKDYSLNELEAVSEVTNYAPNSNPTYQTDSVGDTYVDYNFNTPEGKDHSGNEYHIERLVNADYEEGVHRNALTLNGGESYAETPLSDIGLDTTVDFWVKKAATDSDEEQILFESDCGAIKAVQKDTGKFGFSRWHRDYSFNYELPEEEWVHITLVNEFTRTKLYVNGEFTDELAREAGKGNKWASLVTPIKRIGSTTNAFVGQIDDIVISQKGKVVPEIDTRALAETVEYARYLLDQGEYSGSAEENLRSLIEEAEALLAAPGSQDSVDEMDARLNEGIKQLTNPAVSKKILEYFLNQAKQYQESGEVDDCVESVKTLFKEAIEEGGAVMADEGATREEVLHAAAKLMKAIQALDMKAGDKTDLEMALELTEMIDLNKYVEDGQAEYLNAKESAENVMADGNAFQADVDAAWNALTEALSGLRLKADKTVLRELLTEVEGVDLTKYTEESVQVFHAALAKAQSVMADMSLSVNEQTAVNEAAEALRAARDGLVKKAESDGEDSDGEETPGGSETPDDSETPGSSGDSDGTGTSGGSENTGSGTEDQAGDAGNKIGTTAAGQNGANVKAAKTGDHSAMLLVWLLLTAGSTGYIVYRRRISR